MDTKSVETRPPAPAPPSSHVRNGVVAFAVILSVLSFLDRAVMAQAAPLIARDLHLNTIELGGVLGVYLFSYSVFELPSGWLGDWIGARKVLARVVAWWSVFTILTGAMWSYWSMWWTRLLFGAGEAGGFPNIAKAMATWLPHDERVRAQGWVWVGARWGGAFTPLVVVFLLRYMSWRWTFVVFGLIGMIWVVAFWRWYRDRPADHPGISAAELQLIPPPPPPGRPTVPWRTMFLNRSVQLLCLQYFCLSFSWYFYITWLPTYLHGVYNLSLARTASYAVWPLFFNGVGSIFCVFISVRLNRWMKSLRKSRKALAGTGLALAALFMGLSAFMPAVGGVVLLMACSAFCNDWAMPTCWAACMDVGGAHAGTVSGLMNTFGNIAGFVAAILAGFYLHWSGGNWHGFILLMAAMYVPASLCWIWLDPVSPFQPETAAA